MRTPTRKEMRMLALALLDDDEGINDDAYGALVNFLDDDICCAVEATDGRFYICHDDAKELKKVKV